MHSLQALRGGSQQWITQHLWLQITVHDPVRMQMLHAGADLPHAMLGICFIEPAPQTHQQQ
jgi:hypothetical protein